MKRQLFILDRDMLLNSMSREDVIATWKDMEELGIARPPYQQFTIQVPFGSVVRSVEQDKLIDELEMDPLYKHYNKRDMPVRFEYDTDRATLRMVFQPPNSRTWLSWFEFVDWVQPKHPTMNGEDIKRQCMNMMDDMGKFLIVLLATKNVEKHVVHNRLARFGRGKQEYEYVTTLKIGQLIEDDSHHPPTGMTRRPHLRRGHIRRQRYGPGYQHMKKIFVEPIFVNGWMPDAHDDRGAYNVSRVRR